MDRIQLVAFEMKNIFEKMQTKRLGKQSLYQGVVLCRFLMLLVFEWTVCV